MWIRISRLLLTIKNIALIGVGIGLCIAMINSLINFGFIAWANIQGYSTYDLLIEELITFFLYFEFIALIVKYFKNNFHFPLDFSYILVLLHQFGYSLQIMNRLQICYYGLFLFLYQYVVQYQQKDSLIIKNNIIYLFVYI